MYTRNWRGRGGFTLIELLVVVLVVLLLSALLFRVASLVGDRSARAKAVSDIENIQHALNEFFAEYGTYPPTNQMAYVYENTELQSEVFRRGNQENPIPDGQLGYVYGLVSYLVPRARGNQSIPYNEDTERDLLAKGRWETYLDSLDFHGSTSGQSKDFHGSFQNYSNSVLTIRDPWERSYQYRSYPPYLSYRLWSAGPDGSDDTADDISNETSGMQ